MSNNRHKGTIPDYTPRQERNKKEEVTLTFKPCIVCKKDIMQGYYGRHQSGGTCCKACETEYWELKLTQGDDHESNPVSHFNGIVYHSQR